MSHWKNIFPLCQPWKEGEGHFYLVHVGINYNCRIAVAQIQWRGWLTYLEIVAVWSWLDTEQSMINCTTEIVKVYVCACVCVYVCVFLFKCACMWVHLHAHAHM